MRKVFLAGIGIAIAAALIMLGLMNTQRVRAQSPIPRSNLRVSGVARVNGGTLHYEVYGQGAPIVFLHAGVADARMWDGQVRYFSRKYTVVRFDMRGYGQSDQPSQPYVPADDLYFLLQFLKIDRACIIGSSMGGTVGIDFAVAHPEAVSVLIVVAGSPGWLPYSSTLVRRTSDIVLAAKDKGSAAIVEGWLNDPMLRSAKKQPLVEQQMRMFLSQNTAGILNTSFMRPPKVAVAPKLSDLHVPTLLIVGDHDDPEVVERSRLMSREIPRAKEVIVKDSGHMVNLEKPNEFDHALDRFLNQAK